MYIYKILNTINNKCYIGQTEESPATIRWHKHRYELTRNNHRNTHLQHAWNKYGEDAFTFEVVEECKTKDQLNEAEERWISHYKSLNVHYNIKDGGKHTRHSRESTRKMSQAAKPEGWPSVVSPDGILYEVHSLHGFCKEHGLTYSVMYRVMVGTCRHHKGWKLPNTDLTLSTNEYKSIQSRPHRWAPIVGPDGRTYEITPSFKGFCRLHNLKPYYLKRVLDGMAKTHKGWKTSP